MAALAARSSRFDIQEFEDAGAHAGENAARIPMTEAAVLHLVREHFAALDNVFACPHVPPAKEHAARIAHCGHLPDRERILALYDASWDDRADGFVVTSKRLCWKNSGEPARMIEWRDLDPDHLFPERDRLFVDHDAILIEDTGILDACADAFVILALSALPPQPKASGHVRMTSTSTLPPRDATAPPAHTVSYAAYTAHAESESPDHACWHCLTPLYANTPQCTFCGALPETSGWLRTG